MVNENLRERFTTMTEGVRPWEQHALDVLQDFSVEMRHHGFFAFYRNKNGELSTELAHSRNPLLQNAKSAREIGSVLIQNMDDPSQSCEFAVKAQQGSKAAGLLRDIFSSKGSSYAAFILTSPDGRSTKIETGMSVNRGGYPVPSTGLMPMHVVDELARHIQTQNRVISPTPAP